MTSNKGQRQPQINWDKARKIIMLNDYVFLIRLIIIYTIHDLSKTTITSLRPCHFAIKIVSQRFFHKRLPSNKNSHNERTIKLALELKMMKNKIKRLTL